MEKYLTLLKEKGADLAIIIDPRSVVTVPWTIYKCKFGCNSYGKNRCCPPSAPSYKETQAILDCYTKGILFRTHAVNTVNALAVEMARELFLDGYYKAIAFGDGDCSRCSKCNTESCNFPGKAVPSMEASGIDVFATVRNNGLEINTLRSREEPQNHFGLILVE